MKNLLINNYNYCYNIGNILYFKNKIDKLFILCKVYHLYTSYIFHNPLYFLSKFIKNNSILFYISRKMFYITQNILVINQ